MNTLSRIKFIALFLPSVAAYCALGIMYPYLTQQLGLFTLYFSVMLILPALALGTLLPLGERSWEESLFLGYPPAQVASFLFIFAGARLSMPWLPAALPLLSVLVLLNNLRTGRGKNATTLPTATLLLILGTTTIALAFCFVKFTQISFPLPGMPVDYYHDDVGTAAFVWSAVRSIETGVPFMLPFVSGFQYPYHVIYHYSYAFPTFALGIPPMEQVLFLWPPLHWLMLSGAAIVGCRRLAGLRVGETAVAVLLLLFSEGYGFFSMPTLQTMGYFHTFWFGLPAFLLLLATIYGYLTSRRTQVSAVHAACCYFVAAGTKANLLPFIPIALFPVFVYRLIKRVNLKRDLALVLCFSVAAAVLFFTHYQGLDAGQAQFKAFKAWKLFMGTLRNLETMVEVVGPFALVCLIAADRDALLRHKLRQDWQYHLFLLTFCVSSAIFLKAVNYVGGDFYFGWQARLITVLGFASLAAHVLRWRTPWVAPLTALVLLVGVAQFGYTQYALSLPIPNKLPADVAPKNIDADEVEGLRWASTHLDRTRTMCTNKDHFLGSYLGGSIRRDMHDYLGFSGMQGYAGLVEFLSDQTRAAAAPKYAWVQKLIAAKTPQERDEALDHIGADYYFHCEREEKSDFTGVPGVREVYRNPSLAIYELKRGSAAPK